MAVRSFPLLKIISILALRPWDHTNFHPFNRGKILHSPGKKKFLINYFLSVRSRGEKLITNILMILKIRIGALLQQITKEALSSVTEANAPRIIVRTGTPVTVAALLSASVAPPPRLPDPGAALLFELHEKKPSAKTKNGQTTLEEEQRFGLKVTFQFN